MAFSLADTSGKIKVILSLDSSVKCSGEDYQEYLKTLDESLLMLEGEPTRFLLKKVLPYQSSQKLMSMQAKLSADGKVDFQMGSVLEEVRLALCAVENPESVPHAERIKFTRGDGGGASNELMESLHAHGVVMDLWSARNNSKPEVADTDTLKKS